MKDENSRFLVVYTCEVTGNNLYIEVFADDTKSAIDLVSIFNPGTNESNCKVFPNAKPMNNDEPVGEFVEFSKIDISNAGLRDRIKPILKNIERNHQHAKQELEIRKRIFSDALVAAREEQNRKLK